MKGISDLSRSRPHDFRRGTGRYGNRAHDIEKTEDNHDLKGISAYKIFILRNWGACVDTVFRHVSILKAVLIGKGIAVLELDCTDEGVKVNADNSLLPISVVADKSCCR